MIRTINPIYLFLALFFLSFSAQSQILSLEVTSATNTDVDTFQIGEGSFTQSRCTFPFSDTVVVATDDGEDPTYYCSGTGSNDISGKIALIDRRTCNFDVKVSNAEDNGASGVIICNFVDSLITMTGEQDADIPAVFATKTTCDTIRARLTRGEIVEATFKFNPISTLNTKEVLWGDGENEGDFDGGLNGWTVTDNSCAGTVPDFDVWTWYDEPFVRDLNNFEDQVISSSSCNGYMAFSSAALDAGEGALGSGEGVCPSFQTSSLVSPIIDLSDYDGDVSVNFYQFASFFGGGFFIDYSENGGTDWVETQINTNIGVNQSFNGYQTINLWGAEPTDSFRIRFRANLDYYFWGIDDVLITEAPATDFSVTEVVPLPNFATPVSQVDSVLLASQLINRGANEVYNVQNYYTVFQQGENGFSAIYIDSFLVDTLAFQDTAVVGADNLYAMPGVVGNYIIQAIGIDSLRQDEDERDNVTTDQFLVTPNIYSKHNSVSSSIVPNSTTGKYTFGNVYTTGITNNAWRADSVTINIGHFFEEVKGTGSINVGIYEWNDTENPFAASISERTLVGIGVVQIPEDAQSFQSFTVGLESTASTQVNQEPITLKDTTSYIVTYEWNAPSGSNNFNISIGIGDKDYLGTGVLPYGPISLFASDNANDWQVTTFGASLGYVVPIIRLSITDESLVSSSEDQIDASLNMFPNPTKDVLNIDLNLNDYVSDVQTNVYTIEGRLVKTENFDKVRTLQHQMNVADLKAGIYIVEFRTDRGSYSEQIIKQ